MYDASSFPCEDTSNREVYGHVVHTIRCRVNVGAIKPDVEYRGSNESLVTLCAAHKRVLDARRKIAARARSGIIMPGSRNVNIKRCG